MVKVIIFDFGRTLYDRDNDRFFPEISEVLEKLGSKYRLAIVSLYEQVLLELGVVPEEVVVVDDRVKGGIAWGNRRGATTIWFRNGKFKDEMPGKETGEPTHIIFNLLELLQLLN